MSILGHRPARKGEEDTRFSANHCSFLTRAGIGFWRCDYRLSERKGRAKRKGKERTSRWCGPHGVVATADGHRISTRPWRWQGRDRANILQCEGRIVRGRECALAALCRSP